MSKFKVGDLVKINNCKSRQGSDCAIKFHGCTALIANVGDYNDGRGDWYDLEEPYKCYGVWEEELELVYQFSSCDNGTTYATYNEVCKSYYNLLSIESWEILTFTKSYKNQIEEDLKKLS